MDICKLPSSFFTASLLICQVPLLGFFILSPQLLLAQETLADPKPSLSQSDFSRPRPTPVDRLVQSVKNWVSESHHPRTGELANVKLRIAYPDGHAIEIDVASKPVLSLQPADGVDRNGGIPLPVIEVRDSIQVDRTETAQRAFAKVAQRDLVGLWIAVAGRDELRGINGIFGPRFLRFGKHNRCFQAGDIKDIVADPSGYFAVQDGHWPVRFYNTEEQYKNRSKLRITHPTMAFLANGRLYFTSHAPRGAITVYERADKLGLHQLLRDFPDFLNSLLADQDVSDATLSVADANADLPANSSTASQ